MWVKVSNDVVVQCWDTPPPAGEEGWREAVEVRPPLTAYREHYGSHYFDLTKTPVEIVWPAVPVPVAERKVHALAYAGLLFESVGTDAPEADRVAAQTLYLARVTAIQAAETHDALDAVP